MIFMIYNSPITSPSPVNIIMFTNLPNLASRVTYFLFDSKIYHCIDGVAMGSPLGPNFTTYFMYKMESTFLNSQQC